MKCKNPNLSYMDCWIPESWNIKDPDCSNCVYKHYLGVPSVNQNSSVGGK